MTSKTTTPKQSVATPEAVQAGDATSGASEPEPTQASLFEQLGGEPKLRAIVDDFVSSMFDDVMIGFFFRHASRERIQQKEYEFAAAHLGAPVVYSGRPIAAAHAAHPIMGGQFMRRLQLLKQTLARHGAPQHIIDHFIAHAESLRASVTRDERGQCTAPAEREEPSSDATRKAEPAREEPE